MRVIDIRGRNILISRYADTCNLMLYGGWRADDPAHCDGRREDLRIIELFESNGWSCTSFQAHGGHLFSLQVAAALRLGGQRSQSA